MVSASPRVLIIALTPPFFHRPQLRARIILRTPPPLKAAEPRDLRPPHGREFGDPHHLTHSRFFHALIICTLVPFSASHSGSTAKPVPSQIPNHLDKSKEGADEDDEDVFEDAANDGHASS